MSNEVVEAELVTSRAIVESEAEARTFMELISAAARDPNTNVDKLERLEAMYNRAQAKIAKQRYDVALKALRLDLPPMQEGGAVMNRQNEVQSTFVKWDHIQKVLEPLLRKHGFDLSFKSGGTTQQLEVTARLTHEGSHFEESMMPLPHDTSGGKNAVQGVGSSMSYGMRYTARTLINWRSVGSDNDAQTPPEPITAEHLIELTTAMKAAEMVPGSKVLQRFLVYMRVTDVKDLLDRDFKVALQAAQAAKK